MSAIPATFPFPGPAAKAEEPRKHPDLFTEAEALEYLHLPPDSGATLETFRKSHGLICTPFGRTTLYHRQNLDTLVKRLCGIDTRGRK